MMSGIPPSGSTATDGESKVISAALTEQGGQKAFKLVYRGDSVLLLDSGSLNRWAAIGLVERHKISVSDAGVTIDGHLVAFADPDALASLERLVNRPSASA